MGRQVNGAHRANLRKLQVLAKLPGKLYCESDGPRSKQTTVIPTVIRSSRFNSSSMDMEPFSDVSRLKLVHFRNGRSPSSIGCALICISTTSDFCDTELTIRSRYFRTTVGDSIKENSLVASCFRKLPSIDRKRTASSWKNGIGFMSMTSYDPAVNKYKRKVG